MGLTPMAFTACIKVEMTKETKFIRDVKGDITYKKKKHIYDILHL